MNRRKKKEDALKRTHKQTLLLNSRELKAINMYCERYKISNKAKFMREAIVTAVLKKMDEDHPSLFEDPMPNLFSLAGEASN
jgi:hypothetical protein